MKYLLAVNKKNFVFAATLLLIFSCILSQSFIKIFAEGTYSSINTSSTNDGSNDAINFSQGHPWIIDNFGKYILLTQTRINTELSWVWSNNKTSWTQGTQSYQYLIRGSVAYDSIHDKLHVLWSASANTDGIIYRRYTISRDGSNNITDIIRDDAPNINLQLDYSSIRSFDLPSIIWINDGSANGVIVATWSSYVSGYNDIRSSMRKLSNSSADGIAGNWIALNGSSDTYAESSLVATNKIYSGGAGSSGSSVAVRGGSGGKKDDIYFFVAETNGSKLLAIRGAWNSTNKDWSNGFQSPVIVDNVDYINGNTLKYQLVTKPVIDVTRDRLYVGWANWKNNGDGDVVRFAYLDNTDTVSTIYDVYKANGTHSYAPTMDLAYDNVGNKLYAFYLESTTNGDNGSIDYKTFKNATLSTQTRFYTSPGGSAGANGSADIPIVYSDRTSDNKLLLAFRVNGSLPPTGVNPHVVKWGSVPLPKKGDFNSDNNVNVVDLSILLTKLDTQNNNEIIDYDINNSDAVNVQDLSIFLTLL